MYANSEGSGETAWAFAGRPCDKCHNLMIKNVAKIGVSSFQKYMQGFPELPATLSIDVVDQTCSKGSLLITYVISLIQM